MQLIDTPQELTTSWANLGPLIQMNSFSRLGLFLKLDINDSQNVRVRAVGKRSEGDASNFVFPLLTPSATSVGVEPELYEFTTDADVNQIIEIGTNYIVPYVQIQVQAGTAGATPGEITEADYFPSNAPK